MQIAHRLFTEPHQCSPPSSFAPVRRLLRMSRCLLHSSFLSPLFLSSSFTPLFLLVWILISLSPSSSLHDVYHDWDRDASTRWTRHDETSRVRIRVGNENPSASSFEVHTAVSMRSAELHIRVLTLTHIAHCTASIHFSIRLHSVNTL